MLISQRTDFSQICSERKQAKDSASPSIPGSLPKAQSPKDCVQKQHLEGARSEQGSASSRSCKGTSSLCEPCYVLPSVLPVAATRNARRFGHLGPGPQPCHLSHWCSCVQLDDRYSIQLTSRRLRMKLDNELYPQKGRGRLSRVSRPGAKGCSCTHITVSCLDTHTLIINSPSFTLFS